MAARGGAAAQARDRGASKRGSDEVFRILSPDGVVTSLKNTIPPACGKALVPHTCAALRLSGAEKLERLLALCVARPIGGRGEILFVPDSAVGAMLEKELDHRK